jgi:hypothetical protein
VQEAYRTTNHQDQNRNAPRHVIIKTLIKQNKERILKAVKEKRQLKYKGEPFRTTAQTLNQKGHGPP